jgi:hypothetical protein
MEESSRRASSSLRRSGEGGRELAARVGGKGGRHPYPSPLYIGVMQLVLPWPLLRPLRLVHGGQLAPQVAPSFAYVLNQWKFTNEIFPVNNYEYVVVMYVVVIILSILLQITSTFWDIWYTCVVDIIVSTAKIFLALLCSNSVELEIMVKYLLWKTITNPNSWGYHDRFLALLSGAYIYC